MDDLKKLYYSADATELAELIRKGDIQSRELVQLAIEEIERQNPTLNAVIYKMYESALAQADAPVKGPFAGVPMLLKDDSDVTNTTGSQACAALKHVRAAADSHFIRRLRQAGFVFLGKTNLPEWGLKNITEPHLHGPCRNPHNPEFSPGGSSGGSAAAVASGMVPLASGSDGGGSIRIPSSYCGLVGLKPSRGRVSTGPKYGQYWEGFGTNGVLTRTVRDAAALLDQISGYQNGAPYACIEPEQPFSEIIRRPPAKLRVAFSATNPGVELAPQAVQAARQCAQMLESLGHRVEEIPVPVPVSKILESFLIVCYIAVSGDLEVIKKREGRAALRHIEMDSRVFAEIGRWTKLSELFQIRLVWQEIANTMASLHQTFDLYVTPTTASGPSRIGELGLSWIERLGLRITFATHTGWILKHFPRVKTQIFNNFKRTPHTMLANITGQPAISLPLYYDEQTHLPWGVQFIAPYGREATLLQLGAQLEQTSIWKQRTTPVGGHPKA
ncbi:MAG: amidase family protein [Desulfobacteraceae bacterium]|nr:amidase family protein [Desulfobacteraceae bacterium]